MLEKVRNFFLTTRANNECRPDVFFVKLEQDLHLFYVFLLLTLNSLMLAWKVA